MVNDCFLLRLSSKVHQAYFIFHVALSLNDVMDQVLLKFPMKLQ